HALPEVARIREQLSDAYRRASQAERTSRSKNDPARLHAQHQIQELNARLQRHWEARRDELTERVSQDGTDDGDPDRAVREHTLRVESLTARRAGYEAMLAKLDVANKQEGSDAVKVALVREELASVREMKEAVSKRLEQLRFESKADARISKVSEARVVGTPVSDPRTKLYIAAPLALLFCVFGLFVALELRSARVDDLDALSRLVAIDVHPVPALPAPPTAAVGRLSRLREQRVQDFLRSLDHLRVSLCDDDLDHARPTGRCLLITSAVASEGKTTLAGEFAICCARAGISTLVIDADLRRASLSRMVHEVDRPGLGGVLKGEVSPEDALVFVEEGRFHLLPAGVSVDDPGALLKGRRISHLLAHYRQRYDLLIIDSPPVLPVPDALSLGRWTDGAILVARHGFSRVPLVGRAQRQIAAAGIPILKTVVNGVPSSRHQYGLGGYYGGYDVDPERRAPSVVTPPST
ncbi:MAG: CpsD/CapB family tyrosine-protein kinase, partial [Isosphaeraceae bacterium]|nr:CpsD/CapB family tyrosine-protein kinase [Isosphaeraceae bacterium]